ncbi:YbaK/EbsC family protein [Microbacterium sp. SORGH_AS_0888]|uniref:YbaK/EbsC family protein n=1 Tax=Microbacterium sp. SORGH_AS_0888 TaxID=3041791 RepID=UPI0027863EB1|nr:YbaK/EbsC family protein [Microbacterium sp. SORGH_AS_0888]MDQ1128765.1 prolyl-tRNA editing enzyme YbaK/EbsC (Cys-tRNA(Pro) deacylase) [Microbacterium sp. SORGH_AS_0888]
MSQEWPERVRRVAQRLVEAGIEPRITVLPSGAHTAAAAAAAVGVDVGAIANSLVFWCDGEPLLVMTSGAHRVDTEALAARLGRGPIRRATPEQVREATGQVIGGVAPTGHPAPLTTIVDRDLQRHPVLWAAAGTAESVFPLSFDELVRLTAGAVHPVD